MAVTVPGAVIGTRSAPPTRCADRHRRPRSVQLQRIMEFLILKRMSALGMHWDSRGKRTPVSAPRLEWPFGQRVAYELLAR